jgi:rhamnogalacturonan endolyase
VDDKYEYSIESRNNYVHGWISIHSSKSTGIWLITPSYEFRSAGPLKQYLASHTGPTMLSVSFLIYILFYWRFLFSIINIIYLYCKKVLIYMENHVNQVFHSTHYSGTDLIMKFGANEPWKKVFGPIFIYLNSKSGGLSPIRLWEDAKQQVNLLWSFTFTFATNSFSRALYDFTKIFLSAT